MLHTRTASVAIVLCTFSLVFGYPQSGCWHFFAKRAIAYPQFEHAFCPFRREAFTPAS